MNSWSLRFGAGGRGQRGDGHQQSCARRPAQEKTGRLLRKVEEIILALYVFLPFYYGEKVIRLISYRIFFSLTLT